MPEEYARLNAIFFVKKKVSHVYYTIQRVLVGGCSLPHTTWVLVVCILHIKVLLKVFPYNKKTIDIANSKYIFSFLFP